MFTRKVAKATMGTSKSGEKRESRESGTGEGCHFEPAPADDQAARADGVVRPATAGEAAAPGQGEKSRPHSSPTVGVTPTPSTGGKEDPPETDVFQVEGVTPATGEGGAVGLPTSPTNSEVGNEGFREV